MKTNLLILTVLILVWQGLSAVCSTTGKPDDKIEKTNDEYRLIWQDMFNNNRLDENNWTIEINGDGGGNAELQYYRQENISVGQEPVSGENCLIITAKKENFKNKKATSGRLISKDKVSFKFGKIEARIKLPSTANGLWPAFWMMGVDHSHVGWPACGEIDIMEMGSTEGISDGLQSRCLTAACHWGPGWNDGAYPNYAKATIVSYTLQDDFHLYTLIWDNMSIKMYLDSDKYPDNPPYYELNISEKTTDTSPDNYFKKRFSILFNLAVGGNFTGIWDINQVTALAGGNAHMYVDYVKVYQKGND